MYSTRGKGVDVLLSCDDKWMDVVECIIISCMHDRDVCVCSTCVTDMSDNVFVSSD